MDIALIMILTYRDLQEEIRIIKMKGGSSNLSNPAIEERCIEKLKIERASGRASGFCFLVL